ncbi:MAG TPA: alpha/beta hydrolase [Solirubrobacteraceae bacterium]|nr:alpha/beta hydrolase [Solirubrobacteraceae bacterium]
MSTRTSGYGAPLAPAVQELIEFVEGLGTLAELPLPELRQVLLERDNGYFLRVESGPAEVGSVERREIVAPDGAITLRLYRPLEDGARPAFVHFHGGGFVFGSIDQAFYDYKCRDICQACACVVVSVDYRLAPEHKFPTAPEDCFRALRFVSENAAELGIDPSRIAIGGDSAGGNLAAVVALMARDRGGPRLVLQLLEIPVTDNADATAYPSWKEFGKGYGLEDDLDETIQSAYFAREVDAHHPYASPILTRDLAGLAPAHVMTAEFDILRDSGEAYAKRLEDAGVPTTLRRHRGHVHGSAVLYRTWAPARHWMDEIIGQLNVAFATER